MAKALVLLAAGVEEMEAVIVVDTFRRAEWEVVAASLQEGVVHASRGVQLLGDDVLGNVDAGSFDLLVLPGGLGGVEHMVADQRVLELVRLYNDDDEKTLAAICAAPLVLQEAGVLDDRRYSCHPGVADQMLAGTRCDERVVVDGALVTSQGPGTAFEFALRLVGMLDRQEKADAIAAAMVLG